MQFSGPVSVAQTTPLNLVVLSFGNAWQDFGQIFMYLYLTRLWSDIHVDLHRCEWEEGEGDRRWISTAARLYFSCFPILLWVNWVFLVVSLARDVTVSITPCSGTWEAVWKERWLSPVQSKSFILTQGESIQYQPALGHSMNTSELMLHSWGMGASSAESCSEHRGDSPALKCSKVASQIHCHLISKPTVTGVRLVRAGSVTQMW